MFSVSVDLLVVHEASTTLFFILFRVQFPVQVVFKLSLLIS